LKLPRDHLPGGDHSGFRRTLVGLKQAVFVERRDQFIAFQTNPRGVEASIPASASPRSGFQTNPRGVEARRTTRSPATRAGFRRTLVGLKHAVGNRPRAGQAGFRRTLVGLKLGEDPGEGVRRHGFRRTLVGLKPARRPLAKLLGNVSDEPSWG